MLNKNTAQKTDSSWIWSSKGSNSWMFWIIVSSLTWQFHVSGMKPWKRSCAPHQCCVFYDEESWPSSDLCRVWWICSTVRLIIRVQLNKRPAERVQQMREKILKKIKTRLVKKTRFVFCSKRRKEKRTEEHLWSFWVSLCCSEHKHEGKITKR